jgi:GntR family transcriptional regulator / MocR family aminotransferase
MLESGEYDRHVARARHAYRRKRDLLVKSLGRRLPGNRIEGAAAGLHVLLRLPPASDDRAVKASAAAAGIGVRALSEMSLTNDAERGLVLGYGRLTPERIDAAVAALASVMQEVGARPQVSSA